MTDSPAPLLNPFDRTPPDTLPLLPVPMPVPVPLPVPAVERLREEPSLRSVTPRRLSWDRRGTRGASLRSAIVPSGYVGAHYDLDASGEGEDGSGRWSNLPMSLALVGAGRRASGGGLGEYETV